MTLGAPPILLPLGRGLGGTTLVNSGTCFRTPAAVLERWQREYGLHELTPEALDPCFARGAREAGDPGSHCRGGFQRSSAAAAKDGAPS